VDGMSIRWRVAFALTVRMPPRIRSCSNPGQQADAEPAVPGWRLDVASLFGD
jgi:hypothetical protein